MRLDRTLAAACAAVALLWAGPLLAQAPPASTAAPPASVRGMDEAVNGDMARKAGAPPRRPYIDVEALGDVWNLILLLGGGVAGFVIGRNWDHVWGVKRP